MSEKEIARALTGRGGVEGVQWLLHGARPRDAWRRALQDLLEDGASLEDCRLHRAKYKPGRYLSAHYEVRVRRAEGEAMRPVVVTWRLRDGEPASRLSPDFYSLETEAIDRGLAAPFNGLVGLIPEWGARILISPVDPRFPKLLRVMDVAHVRRMLAEVYGVSVDEMPEYEISTIRYRPDERHVLRYDPVGASAHGEVIFSKMARGQDVSGEARIANRVADWLDPSGGGLHAARPLAALPSEGVVLYRLIPGGPLSRLLLEQADGLTGYLGRVGSVLRALHQAPGELADELVPHDFEAETKAVARAAEAVQALLPDSGALITEILDRLLRARERLSEEAPTFVHGDFKADHLLVGSEELTLLDFGTCRLSDPALDLGKFLADLHWWYAAGGHEGVDSARRAFLEGYGRETSGDRLARARLYEVLILLKSTVRRVPIFEESWAARTGALVRRAEGLLESWERELVGSAGDRGSKAGP